MSTRGTARYRARPRRRNRVKVMKSSSFGFDQERPPLEPHRPRRPRRTPSSSSSSSSRGRAYRARTRRRVTPRRSSARTRGGSARAATSDAAYDMGIYRPPPRFSRSPPSSTLTDRARRARSAPPARGSAGVYPRTVSSLASASTASLPRARVSDRARLGHAPLPEKSPADKKSPPRNRSHPAYDKIMQTKCSLRFGPEMRKRRGPRGPYHEHDAGIFAGRAASDTLTGALCQRQKSRLRRPSNRHSRARARRAS